jgi:hypothetical protein
VTTTAPLPPAKVCTACRHLVPLAGFHRDCHRPDGRRSVCAECANTAARLPGGRGPLVRVPPGATAKRCLGPCSLLLPLGAFACHRRGQAGRAARCRVCVRLARRARTLAAAA